MKLRGTRTESAIRDRLIASNLSIKNDVKIMDFLKKKYESIEFAHVFTCTPDEDGDIYEILINGRVVVSFEISREGGVISEGGEILLADYLKGLRGKEYNLKVLIALDLVNGRA
ncbi:hypothetical protein [Achromobacter ruhlandii]|uniref:hypothetical protein n=1 Tax=Achromobacter ruhlandii TaxID=72557 RepID=UPI00114CD8E1|nr:hypothetical protein [Achromobacter ruhlandii]MEB6661661.1 hypothetical protein [Achromobacter ruhlandii]